MHDDPMWAAARARWGDALEAVLGLQAATLLHARWLGADPAGRGLLVLLGDARWDPVVSACAQWLRAWGAVDVQGAADLVLDAAGVAVTVPQVAAVRRAEAPVVAFGAPGGLDVRGGCVEAAWPATATLVLGRAVGDLVADATSDDVGELWALDAGLPGDAWAGLSAGWRPTVPGPGAQRLR